MSKDNVSGISVLVLCSALGMLAWAPAGWVLYEGLHHPPQAPAPLLTAEDGTQDPRPTVQTKEPKHVRKRRAVFTKYMNTITRHQLFLTAAPAPAPVRGTSITLDALLSKLSLMGVFDGKGGLEAILSYSGKTYTCKGGEHVGPLVVTEVRKGGLVVQYGEETAEVRF